ncbi:MAG: hypothetical protein HUU29_12825 [Planctomycetaceae bacterium]|nr:hypothetical protein [Planctomycetaceae bacterium]
MSNSTNSSGDFPDQYNSAGSSEPSAINGVPSDSLGAGRGEVKSNHAVTPDSHEDTVGYSDVGMGPAALPEEPPVGEEDDADPIDGSEPEEAPPVSPHVDEDDGGDVEDYGESREDDEGTDDDLVGAGVSDSAASEGASGSGTVDATASASAKEPPADDQAAATAGDAPETEGGDSGDAQSEEAVARAGAGVAPADKTPQQPKAGSPDLRSVIENCAAFLPPPVDHAPVGIQPPGGASDGDAIFQDVEASSLGYEECAVERDFAPTGMLPRTDAFNRNIEEPEAPQREVTKDFRFLSGGPNRVGANLHALIALLAWFRLWFVCLRTGQILYNDTVDGKDKIVYVRPSMVPTYVARAYQLIVYGAKKKPGFRLMSMHEVSLMMNTRLKYGFPGVRFYGEGAVYGPDFCLYNKRGYYKKDKVLVVGAPVTARSGTEYLDDLLSEVAFRDAASRANFVGALIGSLLYNAIGTSPIMTITANHPGVGKTLIANLFAAIIDGGDLLSISYSANDREVEKGIGSVLKTMSRVLAVDNAKPDGSGLISSQAFERMSSARYVVTRLLGYSQLIERPNDILWILTANSPRLSTDLVERSVFIQLEFNGDPSTRRFKYDDLFARALAVRSEVRGETIGMVENWKAKGCPLSSVTHRYGTWAKLVGGILEANGYKDFLANDLSAQVEINSELNELLDVLTVFNGKNSFTVSELLTEVEARKLLPALRAISTQRGRLTWLGAKLMAIDGQRIATSDAVVVVKRLNSGAKTARYQVTVSPADGTEEAAE